MLIMTIRGRGGETRQEPQAPPPCLLPYVLPRRGPRLRWVGQSNDTALYWTIDGHGQPEVHDHSLTSTMSRDGHGLRSAAFTMLRLVRISGLVIFTNQFLDAPCAPSHTIRVWVGVCVCVV